MKEVNLRCVFIFFLWFLKCQPIHANAFSDSLTKELGNAISQYVIYDNAKLERIKTLKSTLYANANLPASEQYNLLYKICEEYKVFNFDSAFYYVNKLEDLARKLNDAEKIARVKLSKCFILLSSGLFVETFELLRTIDISNATAAIKIEYYTLKARFYYDLSSYNLDDFLMQTYYQNAKECIDSALLLSNLNSYTYLYFYGLKKVKEYQLDSITKRSQLDSAQQSLEKLHSLKNLSSQQLAIVSSTLSYVYELQNNYTKATELLMEAAISDIKNCTKETIVTYILANVFFYKNDDIENAAIYIKKAQADAQYYGARLRLKQLNPLLQLIQNKLMLKEQQHGKDLRSFLAFISVLLFIALIFASIISRQVKKLRIAKQQLTNVNKELSIANNEKELYTSKLQQTNSLLLEADKIKEEYIGYFFNLDSALFTKVEKFRDAIDKKIAEGRLNDIRFIVNKFNLKEEKEDILQNFDKVFLRLFPDFVTFFNSLFKEEDRIVLKKGQLMNIELRIFALIRMGITDSEKIAQILGYSVNTIYSYKTKIKNKSLVANDNFEKTIITEVQVVKS